MLVSHDARLIETVECQLWVVEDQNVTPWTTGFNGYREYLLKKLEEQLAAIMPGSGERPDSKTPVVASKASVKDTTKSSGKGGAKNNGN